MRGCGVVLFHTTSAALRAEKTLQKNGSAVKLISMPREFSSDCGLALRFAWTRAEQVRALLEVARIETAGLDPLA